MALEYVLRGNTPERGDGGGTNDGRGMLILDLHIPRGSRPSEFSSLRRNGVSDLVLEPAFEEWSLGRSKLSFAELPEA